MRGKARSGSSDRAQTQQDFALGMGLFLVTIIFVFAFIPSAFDFSDTGAGSAELQQAERSSATLLDRFTVGQRQNHVNATAAAEYFGSARNETELRENLALPVTTKINASIRSFDGGAVSAQNATGTTVTLASGPTPPENRSSAEAIRIVDVVGQDIGCTPGCRLVVTTW